MEGFWWCLDEVLDGFRGVFVLLPGKFPLFSKLRSSVTWSCREPEAYNKETFKINLKAKGIKKNPFAKKPLA